MPEAVGNTLPEGGEEGQGASGDPPEAGSRGPTPLASPAMLGLVNFRFFDSAKKNSLRRLTQSSVGYVLSTEAGKAHLQPICAALEHVSTCVWATKWHVLQRSLAELLLEAGSAPGRGQARLRGPWSVFLDSKWDLS